jgi:arabinogalactan endo-1,4-beta-galactosidase
MNALISQSIEITSFVNNPVEVNPLVGGNITVNYSYSSETGSAGNHIYIGLEILDSSDSYQSTVAGTTLTNQQVGNNIQNSVEFFIGSSNELTSDLPTGHYYQVKAILYASGGWTENAWAGYWNTPALILQDTSGFVFSTNPISKGADVSWMTEMESNGFEWKDNFGTTRELLPLLNEYQLDAVRLRVWVDPSVSGANGWCGIDDFVDKAILADAQNMDIMVCIHYSDWWADPGQQNKPSAWTGYTVAQLETAVASHTTDILTALSVQGITPKWVQIGNETNDGMLWTTGKASAGGFSNYAKFLNAGSNAVKSYNSAIKTILHIASGNDNGLFRWNIDGLLNNGFIADRFDIIGMSLYPNETNWISMVDDTYANMIALKTRYKKDVMMVEVGFSNSRPDISHQFLTYLIEKTRQANGQGVFYWEPIAHGNFTSYSKGAWNQDASPSIAMDAFINNSTLKTESLEIENNQLFSLFPNPSNQLITVKSSRDVLKSIKIYDITGKLIKNIDEAFQLSKTINISELQVGIYVLKINNSKSIKFLKH